MLLLELQFRGVFNGDDAVGVGNVSREDIQQSCLAGASSAGHQDIETSLDHNREQFEHRLGQGLVLNHLSRRDRVASKPADGEARTVDGQGWNDGIDARSVGQAGVDHGRRFVDASPHAGDDALDNLHEVGIVLEGQAGQFEFAGALNVDAVETVHQDIGNIRIFEQRLEWTEAEYLIENLARQALALGKAQGHNFAVHGIPNDHQHFVSGGIAGDFAQFFQVKAIEDLAMQVGFYLLVIGALERLKIWHSSLIPRRT